MEMENVELRFEKKKDRQKEEGSKMGAAASISASCIDGLLPADV